MSHVPPPLDFQISTARHEAERRRSRWEYLPYFLVAFAVFPLVRPWFVREFQLSSRASYAAAILIGVIVGFVVQTTISRIRRRRAKPQVVDREEAV